MIILHLILHSAAHIYYFHTFKTSSSPFHGFITNQFNENPSSKASFKAMKLTKSSLFLKTMISDFFLSNGAFLNHNPINKSAKNNKRMLIAAVFYFVDAVHATERQLKASKHDTNDTKLCHLKLSEKKSQMLPKFSTVNLFASSSTVNCCSLPFSPFTSLLLFTYKQIG